VKIVEITKDAVTIEFDPVDLTDLEQVFRDAKGCSDEHTTVANAMELVCQLANNAIDAKFGDEMFRQRMERGNQAAD
jgi:hypothetical protein